MAPVGYSASGQDVWLDGWDHEGTAIILSAVGARCGKAFLATGKWSAVANTHVIWLLEAITLPEFAMLVLNNERYWIRAGGAQPFVKVGKTLDRDFLLPPYAEQKRIVAKVDQLMALCDELEQGSASALEAHQTLVETLLATLVNSGDGAVIARNWARLESHFDLLFRTGSSIDALRQTVLELAVQGKLTTGFAADAPAKEAVSEATKAKQALAQLEGLRARLVITRAKLQCREDGFPLNWVLTDFDSIFVIVSGVTKGQKIASTDAVEAPYLRVANVQRGYLDLQEIKSIIVKRTDRDRYQLKFGDVLMTEGGDWDKLGRAAIWRDEVLGCLHQNHVFRLRFNHLAILPEWVEIFVNSPLGREYFSRSAKQTTNLASINMTQLRSCPFPVPPFAEQQRIVAKVDNLRSLCNALEANIAKAAAIQKQLADAIVERVAA